MTYLIGQIFVCLLLAALIGGFIGWHLNERRGRGERAEPEREWRRLDDPRPEPSAVTPRAVSPESAGGAPAPVPSRSEPAAAKRDDLKKMEGVGPKIAQLLNDAGIQTFAQLAEASVERLRRILGDAGDRYRIHDPSSWPQQARLAADGQWDELTRLQKTLKSGRRR